MVRAPGMVSKRDYIQRYSYEYGRAFSLIDLECFKHPMLIGKFSWANHALSTRAGTFQGRSFHASIGTSEVSITHMTHFSPPALRPGPRSASRPSIRRSRTRSRTFRRPTGERGRGARATVRFGLACRFTSHDGAMGGGREAGGGHPSQLRLVTDACTHAPFSCLGRRAWI